MSMTQVMADIKARSSVGTKLFIYVNQNELADPQTPGDILFPIWQKLNAETWWLYPSGTSGTPVRSTFGDGDFGVINNTDFSPLDAAGKNLMRWATDVEYGLNVVGDAINAANPHVDGFYMDNVFWKPRADGDWNRDGVMIDACRDPKLVIFGHANWQGGDYRGMRYGLASALMGDAYYYISGTTGYDSSNLLWFDKFDFDLGYPTQPRREAAWSQGVWRRDFENGIVLVNPKGNGVQTVELGGTFRKLSGTQDPVTNDGAIVSSVALAERDGILLSR